MLGHVFVNTWIYFFLNESLIIDDSEEERKSKKKTYHGPLAIEMINFAKQYLVSVVVRVLNILLLI